MKTTAPKPTPIATAISRYATTAAGFLLFISANDLLFLFRCLKIRSAYERIYLPLRQQI